MTPIELLLAAPVAELFGVRAWFLAGGSGTLLFAVAVIALRPIRCIEEGAVDPAAGGLEEVALPV